MVAVVAGIIGLTLLGIHQVNIGTKAVQAALRPNALSITQLSNIPVNGLVKLCATSTSPDVNVAQLVWTHHRKLSTLTQPGDTLANCRLYTAPPYPGWDRVKVVFESLTRGHAAATIFTILPNPLVRSTGTSASPE